MTMDPQTDPAIATLIDGVIDREGGFVWNRAAGDPPTKFGITGETLGGARGLGRPATPTEVEALERPEAFAILVHQYVAAPGFTDLPDEPGAPLRTSLVDWGVNSGPRLAIAGLQRQLGTTPDGTIGPRTQAALQAVLEARRWLAGRGTPVDLLALLSNALVAARAAQLDRWTDAHPEKKPLEEGLESRALSFIRYTRA